MIAVVGIGQSMRSDDGAGIRAVQIWQKEFLDDRESVAVDTLELPGIGLLNSMIGKTGVILVDAVQSGSPAGTIHIISEENLPNFTQDSKSAHVWVLRKHWL